MNQTTLRLLVTPILATGLLVSGSGCASSEGNGALIGTGAGAGAGALIGSNVAGSGKRTQGALIGAGAGALIGGLSGAAIGKNGDEKKKEREKEDRYYSDQAPAAPAAAPAPPASPYTPPPQYTPR